MKNLLTAAALSLGVLLASQASFADESPAFAAHLKAHQPAQAAPGAERQVQADSAHEADQQG